MIIPSLIIIGITFILYKRYVPVPGVRCASWEGIDVEKINIIDLRDYNDSYKNPINGSINIPIAYLNRFYKEISNREIHVIGSNRLEKNIGIRYLRLKGFKVTGYTIIEKNNLCINENLCA